MPTFHLVLKDITLEVGDFDTGWGRVFEITVSCWLHVCLTLKLP